MRSPNLRGGGRGVKPVGTKSQVWQRMNFCGSPYAGPEKAEIPISPLKTFLYLGILDENIQRLFSRDWKEIVKKESLIFLKLGLRVITWGLEGVCCANEKTEGNSQLCFLNFSILFFHFFPFYFDFPIFFSILNVRHHVTFHSTLHETQVIHSFHFSFHWM